MGKIESGARRDIASGDIVAAKETVFDDGDRPAGLCELGSKGASGGTATYNNIVEVVFFSHLCNLFYHEKL